MDISNLENRVMETLRGYWRIKAGIAIYRQNAAQNRFGLNIIEYQNVPTFGIASPIIQNETISQALAEIDNYANTRLITDIFIVLLGHLEAYLSTKLTSLTGVKPELPLGSLQNEIQSHYSIAQSLKEALNEIRERRNCIIHSQGAISPRYRNAANIVFSRVPTLVADPSTITVLTVSPGYLSYTADVVIQYCRSIP